MPANANEGPFMALWRQAPRVAIAAVVVALVAVTLCPLVLRWGDGPSADGAARPRLSHVSWAQGLAVWRCARPVDELLRIERGQPVLASWGNVGGCGVGGGGANASGGGVRWVGRTVTGGMMDLQAIASETYVDGGGWFTTFNSRFATGSALLEKWILALNVPVLIKAQEVDVEGEDEWASPAGFGDISFQVTRKLGITNTNVISLSLGVPTGASDVVREGVMLPQNLQLGSGLFSATLQYDHTHDIDSGLIILGGSFSAPLGGTTETDPDGKFIYGENSNGDYRPPSMSTYVYAGWMMGPFVPSAGLTLNANFGDPRQRGEPLDQPRGTASVNVAVEWSTDVVAFLLSGVTGFASTGLQTATMALGVTTSLF